jgi:hypothetical protein
MKKLTLTLGFLVFLFLVPMFADESPAKAIDRESDQQLNLVDENVADDLSKTDKNVEKKSFFKKKKPKSVKEGVADMIIPFLLGFLLGPIGILIVLIANKKGPERKRKIQFALLGWLWWLVILSLLLL